MAIDWFWAKAREERHKREDCLWREMQEEFPVGKELTYLGRPCVITRAGDSMMEGILFNIYFEYVDLLGKIHSGQLHYNQAKLLLKSIGLKV